MVGHESLAHRNQFSITLTPPEEVLTLMSTAPDPPVKVALSRSKDAREIAPDPRRTGARRTLDVGSRRQLERDAARTRARV